MTKKIALVVMPFASENTPSLGVSLLKAALNKAGMACDLHYLNVRFCAEMGLDSYRGVDRNTNLLIGECIFGKTLFPCSEKLRNSAPEYIQKILLPGGFQELDPLVLTKWQDHAEEFVQHCADDIDWDQYDIVGFSSTFQQNTASLSLARLIKSRHGIKVVFGGANCEGLMGQALFDQFDWLDAVVSGEADSTFPRLVRHLRNELQDEDSIPGVRLRSDHGKSFSSPEMITDMDSLPEPDFQDFFDQYDVSGIEPNDARRFLSFETSRGCWWGEKAHCTFCGLNGDSMKFRRKSSERAMAELRNFSGYPAKSVLVTDNILDNNYFDDFIPALIEANLGLDLFYEVKSNLSPRQFQLLKRAGVNRIQPGIESFSLSTLKGMKKGSTPMQGLVMLKAGMMNEIALTWNLLCGFPGEGDAEYESMAELLPKIVHLPPPTGIFEVQVHRFSPFFNDPDGSGVGAIRPLKAYEYVYDCYLERIRSLAYFFERETGLEQTEALNRLVDVVNAWQLLAEKGSVSLVAVAKDDVVHVYDGRKPEQEIRYRLDGAEAHLLRWCEWPRSVRDVTACSKEFSENELSVSLEALLAKELVIQFGHHVISPCVFDSKVIGGENVLDIAVQVYKGRLTSTTMMGRG